MTVKTAADLKPADWKYYRPFTSTEDKYSSSTTVVDGYSVAKDIANELISHYGAKRVILFGSLARGDLHIRSDIDLAVWGIPARDFYRAVAFATGFSKTWKVDLVDGDDCNETLSELIQKEGVGL
jgi:predicted nucleotidyltransferase